MNAQQKTYIPRLLSLILVVFADFYGAISTIVLLLWFITGERIVIVNIFINLMPVILLPAIVWLPLTAIFRKWRSFALNLLALIVFIVIYGEAFIPPQAVPATTETISILTYNLFEQNRDFDSIDSILQQADADIVALQEVSSVTLNYLQNYRPETYPYRIHTTFEADHHGDFLLSRFPLIEVTESRPLRALVDTPSGIMAVYVSHLPYPLKSSFKYGTRRRTINLNNLLEAAQAETVPTLIIGDLNMTEATADYRRIRALYSDVFRATNIGFGFTFPNPANVGGLIQHVPPVLRIDYIFASPEIIPIESRVIHEGVSDHYPLWARISLGEG